MTQAAFCPVWRDGDFELTSHLCLQLEWEFQCVEKPVHAAILISSITVLLWSFMTLLVIELSRPITTLGSTVLTLSMLDPYLPRSSLSELQPEIFEFPTHRFVCIYISTLLPASSLFPAAHLSAFDLPDGESTTLWLFGASPTMLVAMIGIGWLVIRRHVLRIVWGLVTGDAVLFFGWGFSLGFFILI